MLRGLGGNTAGPSPFVSGFVRSRQPTASLRVSFFSPALTSGNSMQRGYLDRPDCRLYYEVDGSGPFLVFAHGLGGNHLSWWQQVPHFRDRYTCVTFAHRGFAPSSDRSGKGPDAFADDLAALIDHLGLADVRLVAQSMGGWTCMTYTLRH